MKKSISTALTGANIINIMELLTNTSSQLESLRTRLSDEQLRRPLGPGERSFVEVVAHLVHCEALLSEAIYLALLLEQPLLPDIHPERQWGKLMRFDLLDISELLAYFRLRRKVLLRVLSSLTPAQWERVVCETGKKRKESVYWRARGLALHELEHVTDLQSKLSG